MRLGSLSLWTLFKPYNVRFDFLAVESLREKIDQLEAQDVAGGIAQEDRHVGIGELTNDLQAGPQGVPPSLVTTANPESFGPRRQPSV